jgi:hypothetical protein
MLGFKAFMAVMFVSTLVYNAIMLFLSRYLPVASVATKGEPLEMLMGKRWAANRNTAT